MDARQFGQYRLETLIGVGGMGEVFRAYDTQRHRSVAIKLLPEVLSHDRGYQRRFRRESYVAAGLREPHVIPIHDFGELEGRLFIDMRLVDGESIFTLLNKHGPMDPSRAVNLISQVAQALDAAHADGLVHRDIKPSNILVTENEFVYVIDFGIAHSMGTDSTVLTKTGTTVGTLDYMAPERFENRRIDGRVDVYSLAGLLHECLTASHPFSGRDLPSLMYAHLFSPPPQPSQVNPNVPKGFDPVVAKGMAKDPRDRFGTATGLVDAARAALGTAPSGTGPNKIKVVSLKTADTAQSPDAPDGPAAPAGWSASPERSATGVETSAWNFSVNSSSPGVRIHIPARDAPADSRPVQGSHPVQAGDTPGQSPVSAPQPVGYEDSITVRSIGDQRPLPVPPLPAPPPLHPAQPLPPAPPDDAAAEAAGSRRQRRRKAALVGVVTVAALTILAFLSVIVFGRQTGDRIPAAEADNLPPAAAPALGETVAASVDVPLVSSKIPTGAQPGFVAVAPNGRYAYVANRESKSLSVVDTAQHRVTATIPVDAGPPQFIAFTPDGERAYLSIYNRARSVNSVVVIDTASNRTVATVPVGTRPFALAVSPDGRYVYVPEHDIGRVAVMETANNTVVTEINVLPNPHSIAFSADGRQAYIANHESNVISVLDTASNTVTATVPVGRSPHSVAVSPDQETVANVNYDGNSVSVIDRATNTVSATIPVGINPQDIEFAPDGGHAYVANNEGGVVSVINMQTNKVTTNVLTGETPTSIAVTPDGRSAYVTNLDSGDLAVLNASE
jgi:YVTN family beta-propeller protein